MIAVAADGRPRPLPLPPDPADSGRRGAQPLADLEKADRALAERLRTEFRLDERLLKRLDALARLAAPRAAGLGSAGCGLLSATARSCPVGCAPSTRECRGVPRRLLGELEPCRGRRPWSAGGSCSGTALHGLFHYWHVIHKPFAVVMYVFMVVHVVVASMTGYGWAGDGAPVAPDRVLVASGSRLARPADAQISPGRADAAPTPSSRAASSA